MKVAVCVIARNVGTTIREWLAWYELLGFDAAIVLDHGSYDDTAQTCRRARSNWDVRLHPFPVAKGIGKDAGFQRAGFKTVCDLYAGEFDWIAMYDADEFLVPKVPFKQWLASFGEDVHQVGVNWAFFGSNGHKNKPTGLLTVNYQRRADTTFGPTDHVKMLVRPEHVIKWHNPHAADVAGRSVGPDGATLEWGRVPGIIAGRPSYEIAQVNHYFTRSQTDWHERMARQSNLATQRTMAEFHAYDRNDVEDRLAAVQEPALRRIMNDFSPVVWTDTVSGALAAE